ncbi:MAG: glycosyltransferase family 39 protein [Epsilonproteobacteria bacterium]|nr:glycosyltransferase family 39 protein [Campylobacterota bacterium]
MRRSSMLLLAVSILFLLFFRLGSYGLIETSDARYSEISLEMANSGDYITPRLNGIKHFDKPPLTYWLAAAGIKLLGKNEWGVRIFQGIIALIIVLFVYLFAGKFVSKENAAYSAVFLVSIPIFFGSSHVLTTDLLNSLSTTGALFSFFLWYKKRQFIYLILFYVSIGISFLIKGPIGLFVILPILVLFLMTEHNLKAILKMRPWMFIISLLIAAPWYIALIKQNPGLLSYLIDNQLLSRLHKGGLGHPRPMLYYLWMFPITMFPAVIPAVFQKKLNSFKKFLLIAALWPPIFFSIPATKLPLYILPSAPFIAILASISSINFKKFSKYGSIVMALVYLVAAALFYTVTIKHIAEQNKIALLLSVSAVLIIILHVISKNRFDKLTISSFTVVPLAVTMLFLSPVVSNLKIYKPFMKQINAKDKVIEYRCFVRSIPFYLNHPVKTVGLQQELRFDSKKTIKKLVVSENNFWKLWQSEPLKVIINRDDLKKFRHYTVLASKKKLILISN